MNTRNALLLTTSLTLAGAVPASAGGSAEHFSESLAHSAQAVGHSAAAGFKVVFAAAAVPLIVVGEIGKASGEIGEELWEEANRPIGEPLEITGEVVIAGPAPAEAINGKNQQP
jgi:hypothetical protein